MNRLILKVILLLLVATDICHAVTRIAVLNFELNDMTALPNTPEEQKRTASMKNLLEQALNKQGDYEIIYVNPGEQAKANSSFGYLFRFNDLAAKYAQQIGADWVVVGQHSKPSFLYSYLLVHLINVKTQRLAADFSIELKGNHVKVTERGIKLLAGKIGGVILGRDHVATLYH